MMVHGVNHSLGRNSQHIAIQIRHHLNGAVAASQHLLQDHQFPRRYKFQSDLARANPGGAYEIRPIRLFLPGAAVS